LAVERKRARTVERYNLRTVEDRKQLAEKERLVFEKISSGQQPACVSEKQAAQRAARKGWVKKFTDGWQLIEPNKEVAFIPNTFVATKEGHSPLYRLVNYGELGPLMLAANLYQLQNLMDHRGVPPQAIVRYFSTERYHRFERHRLHLMRGQRSYTDADGEENSIRGSCNPNFFWKIQQDEFWSFLKALEEVHVVEWSVYSANGKPAGKYDFKRPQRPLGVLRNDRQSINTPESRPAFLTYLMSQLQESGGQLSASLPQVIAEWREQSPIIAWENASVSHVEGVGILRMTHRADTENAKVWFKDLCKECNDAVFFIERSAQRYFPQMSDFYREFLTSADFCGAIST
jgi:hypothetical protein